MTSSARWAPLDSLDRLHGLDATRGIAALAVMLYHVSPATDASRWFAAGPLAVDLFFCLSGIVLWRQHAPRLRAGLTLRHFLWERWARLYPMYFVGTVLGLLAVGLARDAGWADIALLETFSLALLMLPTLSESTLTLGHHVMHGDAFPLNNPSWSLFFEMLVGLSLFAWVRLRSWRWMVLPVGLLFIGWVKWSGHTHAAMGGGWGIANLDMGLPRALYAFSLGVLIARLARSVPGPTLPRWAVSQRTVGLLTLSMLSLPVAWFRYSSHLSMLAAVALIPLILWLNLQTPAASARPLARLGALSYPIYILHTPVYILTEQLCWRIGGLALGSPWVVAASVLGTLWLSHWCMVHIDRPVRMRLARLRTGPADAQALPATPAVASPALSPHAGR